MPEQAPQSDAHEAQSSPALQVPSPQTSLGQVPQPRLVTLVTQSPSHSVVQQYGSSAQTQASTEGSLQPVVEAAAQQVPEQAPQSDAHEAQSSPEPQVPSPQTSPAQVPQLKVATLLTQTSSHRVLQQ